MIKLTYPIEYINMSKFHKDPLPLGVEYALLLGEVNFTIQLPRVFESEDEDGIKSYKVLVESFGEDEEGNPIRNESQETFDMDALKATIDGLIASHDPTPIPIPISDEQKILDMVNYLMERRLIDDGMPTDPTIV